MLDEEPDVLELPARSTGDGPSLIVLHGLFGSARNWDGMARRLGADWRVHALDLRNHGDAPWSDRMDYPAMAADVAASVERLGEGSVTVLGHSMGGKVACVLALTRPELVRRLIVADIAPTHARGTLLPYAHAMRGLDLAGLERRSQADARLAQGVRDPMIRGFLLQNLVPHGGGLRWRINLDAIVRHMDTIMDFPEPPPGAVYEGSTLFLTGGRSDYVRPEDRPRIEELFPATTLDTLPDAGHWLHAEQPDAFLARVRHFLEREA